MTMCRENDYGQPCYKCGQWVEPHAGFCYPGESGNYSWRVYHSHCDSRNGTARISMKAPPPKPQLADSLIKF
jgi:hypothetical protein